MSYRAIRRSAIAVDLALAVPPFLSLFSNRPTRVAMPPSKYPIPFTLIPLANSLNVDPHGSGGYHLLLMGMSPHSFVYLPSLWALTVFPVTGYRFAERPNFTALSLVASPSLSLRARLPAPTSLQTARLESVIHGPSTSLLGPKSSSSGVMTEE